MCTCSEESVILEKNFIKKLMNMTGHTADKIGANFHSVAFVLSTEMIVVTIL